MIAVRGLLCLVTIPSTGVSLRRDLIVTGDHRPIGGNRSAQTGVIERADGESLLLRAAWIQ
jgi:hypothetical protein